MVFLQGTASSRLAAKNLTRICQRVCRRSSTNPYTLATDIFGIGFITADKIAGNLGISKNLRSGRAGILDVLHQLSDEGTFIIPTSHWIEECKKILGVERDTMIEGIRQISFEKKLSLKTSTKKTSEEITRLSILLNSMFVRSG